MEHLVLSWADETRTTRCGSTCSIPGVVATRLRAEAMPGEDPATLARPEDVAPALARLCRADETRHGETLTRETA